MNVCIRNSHEATLEQIVFIHVYILKIKLKYQITAIWNNI